MVVVGLASLRPRLLGTLPPAATSWGSMQQLIMPFVRQERTTDEAKILDIAVAQTTTAIQPHGMADDCSRKAVMLVSIDGGWGVHATRMPYRESPQHVDHAPRWRLETVPPWWCAEAARDRRAS